MRQTCLTLAWLAAVCLGSASTSVAETEDLQLPELGDASSSIISPELEKQIGEDFLKQVHAALPTVSDPISKYYIDVHMGQIVRHSQLRESVLQVVLIDDENINAFAAPGGVVGINAGLLLHAEDVHEYSSVVAHELAHLSQRHFARGVEEARAQTLPTLASLLAALMIGAIGGGDAGIAAISTAQAAAQNRQLRYSRTREQEADRIGFNTLVTAGLDPAGMARMFERMHRAYRFTKKPPEFLLTHPLTDSRITDARQQALATKRRTSPDPRSLSELDYQIVRARMEVKYAASPQAAIKQFEHQLEQDPDNVAAEYGLAFALSQTGEHTAAVNISESLLGTDPQKILYIATYAESLIAAERTDEAIRVLTRHLAINPDNPALSMLYAQALEQEHSYNEAQAVLARQSKARPRDVDVWYNLAEIAGKAGDTISVHRARAEYFALHGGYARAIQHLEYAQRLVSRTDRRVLAQIDQRIRDLREALREAQS